MCHLALMCSLEIILKWRELATCWLNNFIAHRKCVSVYSISSNILIIKKVSILLLCDSII